MALFDFLKSDSGNFFQWFEDAAGNTLQAALALRDLCYNYHSLQDAQNTANRLHEYEHRGDEIGHRIYEQLNQSFVTPLDREDIISLYSSIDDMTDFIHSAADMMAVYKVNAVPRIARELADCIVGCAQEVVNAVPHLRKRGELRLIDPSVIQINSLENVVIHPCAHLVRHDAPLMRGQRRPAANSRLTPGRRQGLKRTERNARLVF